MKLEAEYAMSQGEKGADGEDGKMLYAICETVSATAEKVAALVGGTMSLKIGATVSVKFTYANNAANPTLNVAGTGAKAIYNQGVRYAYWAAGATVAFTYDGAYWRVTSEPVYANTAVIGNPAGQNIYIDGSKVCVRKGSTVLASFDEAEIKLGNEAGAIISMCGNKTFIMQNLDDRAIMYNEQGITLTSKRPSASGYWGAVKLQVLPGGVYVTSNDATGISRRVATIGTVLYKNPSGTTESFKLSDAAENYDYLEIFFGSDVSGDAHPSRGTKIPVNGGTNGRTQVKLETVDKAQAQDILQMSATFYEFNGTDATAGNERYVNFNITAGTIKYSNSMTRHIRIYKVVGYK